MTYNEYANLFLEGSQIPCIPHITGQSHGMAYGIFMVDYPWGYGYTLGNVASLTPTLLQTGTESLGGWGPPRIGMTADYTFWLSEAPYPLPSILHRVNKNTLVEDTYNSTDYGTHSCFNFVIYDENTVFTIEDDNDISAESTYCQLCKVTFNRDGTTIREIIHSESFWNYYSGNPSDMVYYNVYRYTGDIMCIDITYMKYNGIDCIIVMQNWESWEYPDDGSSYEWLFKTWIYNINANTIDSQWIVPAPDSGISYDLWEGYIQYGTVTPTQYESKYIITFDLMWMSRDDPHYWDDPPYFHPKWTTIMIDIRDNSIAQVYNQWYSDWNYDTIQWGGGVIDYDTGTYYFQVYSESYDYGVPHGTNGIITMNITGISQHTTYARVDLDGSNGFQYFQAQEKAYGINLLTTRDVAPEIRNIYELSTMTVVNTITIYYANGFWFEAMVYVDREKNMMWSFGPDKLEGKSLIGGADRDIPILWDTYDGTIPFTYGIPEVGGTPNVFFRVLDKSVIVIVCSSSELNPYPPPNWWFQQDFYLLKETI